MAEQRPEDPSAGPSDRGEETRLRILRAALRAFGDSGFERATTRRIAEAAGVNLPAIRYYFEGKEGLYLACARYIVDRYRATVGPDVLSIAREAGEGIEADTARERLKTVMRLLLELGTTREDASLWTGFVLREMAEPGPGFAILYDELWAPGVELTATLIAQIRGRRTAEEPDRIRALLLQNSLGAFSANGPVSLKYLGWEGGYGERMAAILTQLEAEIDAI